MSHDQEDIVEGEYMEETEYRPAPRSNRIHMGRGERMMIIFALLLVLAIMVLAGIFISPWFTGAIAVVAILWYSIATSRHLFNSKKR